MKRMTIAAIVAGLLCSGCPAPTRSTGSSTRGGTFTGELAGLMKALTSRAEEEKRSLPMRVEVRPVAQGYSRLLCTEEPGSRILLYIYFKTGDGSLLEGSYYCYNRGDADSAAEKKDTEEAGLLAPIVWSRKAPDWAAGPSEYEKYDFSRGVLVRAQWYRQGEQDPVREDERDSRGIEQQIIMRGEGVTMHVLTIGENGFPVVRKTYNGGNFIRADRYNGPFAEISAERIEGGRNISGRLLPNYRHFRAADFDFVMIVDEEWNVRGLSARERSARFNHEVTHEDASEAAKALEKCFGWSLKDFTTRVRTALRARR